MATHIFYTYAKNAAVLKVEKDDRWFLSVFVLFLRTIKVITLSCPFISFFLSLISIDSFETRSFYSVNRVNPIYCQEHIETCNYFSFTNTSTTEVRSKYLFIPVAKGIDPSRYQSIAISIFRALWSSQISKEAPYSSRYLMHIFQKPLLKTCTRNYR